MFISLITVPTRAIAIGTMLFALAGALGSTSAAARTSEQAELIAPILGIPASIAPREAPVYAPNFILALRDEVAA